MPTFTNSAMIATVSSIGVQDQHVLTVQVNDIKVQALQAKFNLVTSVLRLVVSAQEFAVGSTDVTEFGADEHLVALTLQDLTKKFFVGAASIHICRSHIVKRSVFVFREQGQKRYGLQAVSHKVHPVSIERCKTFKFSASSLAP